MAASCCTCTTWGIVPSLASVVVLALCSRVARHGPRTSRSRRVIVRAGDLLCEAETCHGGPSCRKLVGLQRCSTDDPAARPRPGYGGGGSRQYSALGPPSLYACVCLFICTEARNSFPGSGDGGSRRWWWRGGPCAFPLSVCVACGCGGVRWWWRGGTAAVACGGGVRWEPAAVAPAPFFISKNTFAESYCGLSAHMHREGDPRLSAKGPSPAAFRRKCFARVNSP
jgi:hypothetical protein